MPLMNPPQPYTGTPPDWYGAVDWAPGEQSAILDAYHMSHGRALGDPDEPIEPALPPVHNTDGALLAEQRVYPNELELLNQLDDDLGNGIFDAGNTQPQLHADAGVFASHAALPGYLAREKAFHPSEVLDINTGLPTVYAPANVTMLDPRTPDVMRQRNLYEPGLPNTGGMNTPYASTWIPDTGAQAIGAAEPGKENHGLAIMLALVGVGVGIMAATLATNKKKGRR